MPSMRRVAPWRRWVRFLAAMALIAAGGPLNLRGQARAEIGLQAAGEPIVEVAAKRRGRAPRRSVARDSIFGVPNDDRVWTPLPLATLLSEGWDEPWIAPPADSNMPVRQGWVNSADGLFFRNLVWLYQNTEGLPGGRDANFGLFQFQSPLSRRLWIGLDIPFVAALNDDHGPYNAASFGDFTVTPRVMLHETKKLSIIAGLGVRTPTGSLSTLTGLARLNPNLQFWADIGHRFSVRGGTGVDVPLNNFDLLPTNLATNIALGQTITSHDRLLIGDFQYYLSANLRNNLSTAPGHTFFSLTPGFRTHLGGEYFLAGGYEIPLTGPRPFGNRLTFFFVKGF